MTSAPGTRPCSTCAASRSTSSRSPSRSSTAWREPPTSRRWRGPSSTSDESFQPRVVAEGIETEDQLERLLRLGCELGQGFYFAKPMDAAGIERLLGERGALPRGHLWGPVPGAPGERSSTRG